MIKILKNLRSVRRRYVIFTHLCLETTSLPGILSLSANTVVPPLRSEVIYRGLLHYQHKFMDMILPLESFCGLTAEVTTGRRQCTERQDWSLRPQQKEQHPPHVCNRRRQAHKQGEGVCGCGHAAAVNPATQSTWLTICGV